MLSRSYLRILFAISCVALAMTLGACGSKQDAKSSSQSHASTSKSEDTPDLKGDELKVCNEYKDKGVIATKQSISGGAAFEFAASDESLQNKLRDKAEKAVDERQKLEDAFKDVKASKHDGSDGIYVQFEHEKDDVLDAVKDVIQHGVNQNPQARKRVDVKKNDDHVIMQLPSGGALVSSKTDSAAKDTVDKWTDRKPAKLSFEKTDEGGRIEVKTDKNRVDEIQKNVIEPLFDCD